MNDCYAGINQVANIYCTKRANKNFHGTAIHAAVLSGNVDIVRYLITEHEAVVYALSNAQNEKTQHALALRHTIFEWIDFGSYDSVLSRQRS